MTGDPTADNFFDELRGVVDDLADVSWPTVWLSVATLVVLVAIRRLAPQFPAPLVAVVGGIVLVAAFSIDEHGVALIAPVPSGLPTPVAPTVDGLGALVPGAFAIAIMVFLESVAVARAVRQPTEPPIDNDQELAANGLACAVGAFFRAMPAAGGFSQTAINQRAGAMTQLSQLVTVTLAVCCALFLGGVLSDLPEATLACMVVVAVIGLIDVGSFVRFWRLSRLEFWISSLTAATGLVLGLLPAVLFGVILTLFLVIVELDRVGLTELQPTPADADLLAAGDGTSPVDGLVVLRLDGPLYTANVRSVNHKLLDVVDARDGVRVLVVDATAVGQLTVSVIDEFAELERELAARDVTLWIAGLPPRALQVARQLPRWSELGDADRLHPSGLAAVRAYRTRSTADEDSGGRDATRSP